MSSTEKEFAEYDSNNAWNGIYQHLKNEASVDTRGDNFTTLHARDPQNRKKNRYRDVSPYDHSRVSLQGDNDYINASLVEVPEANRKYILTQGPLNHTMSDFWQMTWEQDSKAIVMLNRVIEKGTLKCSQYWPLGDDQDHDDELYFPENGLRVSLMGNEDFKNFAVRTLELENMETGEKREVLHFHYTTWPDFGVPSSPNAFLHFLYAVRQTGSLDSNVGPAIIHCSAGIGRSGTFCLVDSCLIMVEKKSTLSCINVKETLKKMRTYRMGLIQTADQLRFSYLAIIQGANVILNGEGLSILDDSKGMNTNNVEDLPPPPPERVSSLSPPNERVPQEIMNLLDPHDTEPPPLPPKRNTNEDFSTLLEEWGDQDEEEFDNLIDREEEGESTEEEEVALLAAERQAIRERRKKETMKKLQDMKEKQRRSTYSSSKGGLGPKWYFGLAILVGVAGVVIYKYFW